MKKINESCFVHTNWKKLKFDVIKKKDEVNEIKLKNILLIINLKNNLNFNFFFFILLVK